MDRKVVVHLYGGIGNQLFQYTFGEYVRYKHQMDVYYDISSFGVLATFRDLQIKSVVKEIPVFETNKYFFSRHTRFYRRISRWFFNHKPGTRYFDNAIDEKVFSQDDWKLLYLDGYWHDKKYAEWIFNNKGNLYLPQGVMPESLNQYISFIKENNVISVHIRRGDYLNSVNRMHLGVCTLEYYQKAIEIIKQRVDNPSFLFFSDDTDWVKENFILGKSDMIVENEDIPPFWYIYLMSLCSHNIMSNSTFSWWGNFLNTNPEKVTIAPRCWYLDENNPHFYGDNWTLI